MTEEKFVEFAKAMMAAVDRVTKKNAELQQTLTLLMNDVSDNERKAREYKQNVTERMLSIENQYDTILKKVTNTIFDKGVLVPVEVTDFLDELDDLRFKLREYDLDV